MTNTNTNTNANARNLVNLTVTVSKEERRALKQIALDRDTTVSALIREWLKGSMAAAM